MGEEENVNRGDLRVKPDVYIASLLDEVNEHLIELIDKIGPVNKQNAPFIKFYTTPETSILVATPNEPNSPDTISDPAAIPPTPGYQAHTIYETLQRRSPRISVSNDGTDRIFVISSSDADNWTPENLILPGASRDFYNVYELRLRSPTVGNTTNISGGVYNITEYGIRLGNTGINPSSPAYTGLVNIVGSANTTTVLAAIFGLPMNSVFDSVTPLGIGATFFGAARDFNFSRLGFMGAIAGSDVASAVNGFRIQQSHDGFIWDFDGDAVTTAPLVASRIKGAIATQFARVAYTNGAVAQAAFRIGSRATIS